MSSFLMPCIFSSLSKFIGCCCFLLVLFLLVVQDMTHAFYILENPENLFGGRAIALRGKRNVPVMDMEEPQQRTFLVEWVEPGEIPLLQQSQPMLLKRDQNIAENDERERVYVTGRPEIDDYRQLVLLSEMEQPNEFRQEVGLNGGRFMKRPLPEQTENVDQPVLLSHTESQQPQAEEDKVKAALMERLLLAMNDEVEIKTQESEQVEAFRHLMAEAIKQEEAQRLLTDQMDYLQRAQQLKDLLKRKWSQPATNLIVAFELANEHGQALLPENVERAFQVSNGQPTKFLTQGAAQWKGSDEDIFPLQSDKRLSPANYKLVMIP